eukprot:497928-Amphidinium_carterae.1
MEYMKRHTIYERVDASCCQGRLLDLKWIDTDKGGGDPTEQKLRACVETSKPGRQRPSNWPVFTEKSNAPCGAGLQMVTTSLARWGQIPTRGIT